MESRIEKVIEEEYKLVLSDIEAIREGMLKGLTLGDIKYLSYLLNELIKLSNLKLTLKG